MRVVVCAECRADLPKSAFSKSQLKKRDGSRCQECTCVGGGGGGGHAEGASPSAGVGHSAASDTVQEATGFSGLAAEAAHAPEGTSAGHDRALHRVSLHSLQSKPELNGAVGHVIKFDEGSCRYVVELTVSAKGEIYLIKAKPENVTALEPMAGTLAEVQGFVDVAASKGPGARVALPSGDFDAQGSASAVLNIPCALTIKGDGPEKTHLHFAVSVAEDAKGELLRLNDFSVNGAPVTIRGKGVKRAQLTRLKIDMLHGVQSEHRGSDALMLKDVRNGDREDTVVVEECEVRGGSDGVFINVPCTIRKCKILNAQSRGIFGNECFTIESSTVQGCGGYGMKTRAICRRVGRNKIQAGPWDDSPWNFGGGLDKYGGGIPLNSDSSSDEDDYDDDDDDDDDDDERGAWRDEWGFTAAQEEELAEQGVRPWDEDAHDVLRALRGDY